MILPVTNASPLFLTRVQVADADYTVTQTNGLSIAYTSLTASRVINLPASSLSLGQIIHVVDETGNCTSTVTLTITPNGSDTIEGNASKTISYPHGSVTIENSGTGKWVITANPNPNLSAGMQIQPGFTDLGTGSCTIGTGTYCLYANSDGTGKIKSYVIAGNTFTLTDLTTNYIVANYNAGSPVLQVITDVTLINETTIIPVFTIYRQGTVLHVFEWDQLGDALTNKIHKSIVKTQRYRLESGLGIGEAATRLVTVGSGTVWTGAIPTTAAAFNSSVNTLRFAYHVAGVWNFSVITQYNNTQYDDGTNLQTTSGGKYVVNFVYRSIGTDNECFIVLGNLNYGLGDAQVAQPPPNLPSVITSHCILVGRIIVQQGNTTATQIDSAFNILFTPAGVTDHESLTGLLGGITAQHYHLTGAEYTGTGTGNFVRASGPTVATPTFATSATFSYLTSGRVPFSTTGGSLVDNANLTYTAGTGLKIADATASTSTSTGALAVTGGVGVGGALNVGGSASMGALTTTSINFGGSTLSAYSVGTWVPTWAGLTTTGSPIYTCQYVKIGPIVFLSILVNANGGTTSSAGGGGTLITNLPFTVQNGGPGGGYAWNISADTPLGDTLAPGNTNNFIVPPWSATSAYIGMYGFYFV